MKVGTRHLFSYLWTVHSISAQTRPARKKLNFINWKNSWGLTVLIYILFSQNLHQQHQQILSHHPQPPKLWRPQPFREFSGAHQSPRYLFLSNKRNCILFRKLFWPIPFVRKNWFSDRKKLRGWRAGICKNFEIVRTIYSNSERSEIKTKYISNMFLEILNVKSHLNSFEKYFHLKILVFLKM
jgi:hypothetical protein